MDERICRKDNGVTCTKSREKLCRSARGKLYYISSAGKKTYCKETAASLKPKKRSSSLQKRVKPSRSKTPKRKSSSHKRSSSHKKHHRSPHVSSGRDTWNDRDGIMAYSEIRLREVDSGKADLNKYRGYFYSEKMDGWHCIWDGKGSFFTKSGKRKFNAPTWFRSAFPKGVALSGELIVKGGQATDVSSLQKETGPWKNARFYAFDLPGKESRHLPFSVRTAKLKEIIQRMNFRQAKYIKQSLIRDPADFLEDFHAIVTCTGKYKKVGECLGEGVVITNPDSRYVSERVGRMVRVKLKRRQDNEAQVIGHNPSSKGGWGSLLVRFNDKTFNLGIGLTNFQRENLPREFPVGTLVKFSFRSLGKHGVPKEARIMGTRHLADMRPSTVSKTKVDVIDPQKRKSLIHKLSKSPKSLKPLKSPKHIHVPKLETDGDCVNMSDIPKYRNRKSPPYAANTAGCRGRVMKGNDGKMYRSELRGKSFRWVLYK